jgi:hypothetical protein
MARRKRRSSSASSGTSSSATPFTRSIDRAVQITNAGSKPRRKRQRRIQDIAVGITRRGRSG